MEIPAAKAPLWIERVTMGGIFWLLATFVGALLRLAFSLTPRREVSFGVAGLGISIIIGFLLPDFRREHSQLSFVLCCLPLLALPGIALFRMDESNDAPRTFILRVLSAIFISGLLSGAAWVLGIFALLGIDMLLFKLIGIGNHISVLSVYAFVFAMPLLTLLYLRTTETLHSLWERLFEALSRYVLLPAIVLYEIILAAYSIKIVSTGEMPKGTVAVLVSFCTLLAIAVFTLLPASGSTAWRRVKRGLFLCLAPFLGFLWYAIVERLSAHGFTADRYLLLVSAVCLTATTLWAIALNRAVLPFFSSTIAVGALVALAGPIGFESVSTRSQWSRLIETLETSKLLLDGKWRHQSGSLPFKLRLKITSNLSWFSDHHLHEKVTPILDDESKKIWTKPSPCDTAHQRCFNRGGDNVTELLAHLGIKPAQSWERDESNKETLSISLPSGTLIASEKGAYAGYWISCGRGSYELSTNKKGVAKSDSAGQLKFSNHCRTLSLFVEDQLRCEIPDLLVGMKDVKDEPVPKSALFHSASGKECSIRFLAHSLSFQRDDGGNIIPGSASVEGMIWIDIGPTPH